jgi:hypothetical protein
MPASAQKDLLEWKANLTVENYLVQIVGQELPADQITLPASRIEITDDRPYNEYFLLRQWGL